jgi:type IV pilus biogenesis protein CpaD/CtpE
MKTYVPMTGWLRLIALGAIALGAAACSNMDPFGDDVYQPTAHYERHPIIVTKTGVYAKDCGHWTEDMTDTSENTEYENLGCSQQNNIAAMVADKDDLWRPRKQTPSDAARRSKTFDKYREGQATAAAAEAKQKVTISDVGGGG